ncbi:DNA polymerase IV [Fusibacter bizertensis]|uniref:DNA polymerase IV n=1 Tax=Fusibacter bizertensis TaxID=1488331 RepID=A0ABT6NHP6_9FIRM|nr:DNA polymerase IV [Fusibacter bizertensis]MDH8679902.1 DNA polymerase IV [Fusibacter bizertensis]
MITNRKIIHFDIDAFFASVEQLDHPEFKGKPLIVGGDSDRSVVSTCSYEARVYGVKSAMSIVVAKKLCPHGIYVYGNMKRYSDISHQIFEWIESQFEMVQRVSIDEAYIDVSDFPSPWEVAREIKKQILSMTGLTVSVGISYNKFLAKLASDWNKPDGIFEIKTSDIPNILLPLPIIKIHGLGKKTCEKLNRIGIFTIEDLYQYPSELLNNIIGESWAKEIVERIHGIDHRPVKEYAQRKSYGKETTLEEDTEDREQIYNILKIYLNKIHKRLEEKGLMAKTLTIKIKYGDFEQFTKSHSLEYHTNDIGILTDTLQSMYDSLSLTKNVRLVGLTFSNFEDIDYKQFNLLELTSSN